MAIVSKMGAVPNMPGLDSAKSFLALISDRSPGDRTKAELTKTKKKAAATSTGAPRQRALAKVAKPELPKDFVNALTPPPPTIEDVPAIAPIASIGPTLLTPPPVGGGGGVVIPPQAPPPGGGGTPTPNGPDTPPDHPPDHPPPPPPPSVPEPGTWATMLIGFGLTGIMIRRRRRTAAAFVPG